MIQTRARSGSSQFSRDQEDLTQRAGRPADLDRTSLPVGGLKLVPVVQCDHGKEHMFMLMPEVTQRGQSHASFKFMFNDLYYGPASH